MKWCQTCLLPDTRPNLVIGEDGICNACKSHGTKDVTDWEVRAADFKIVVENAKARAGNGYDCLIPVSGGKDSTWQVVACLEHGLHPLAVTWKTPGRTEIGQRNLDNLVSLGVDHIDYQINPKVEAAFMVKAFKRFGATAVPMHTALFNIPLSIAVRFNIPLVVWGENSALEYGSADTRFNGYRLDSEWLRRFGVTHGTSAADWVDDELSAKDLAAYYGPNFADLDSCGIHAVFLGYYFQWDPETSLRIATEHGFQRATGQARTGYYDYADIDDDFISLHHWMKWYKFGFSRLHDNLSLEIRNGRLTRDQAIAIIRERGDQTPHADIDTFCRFTGLDRDTFFAIAETHRNHGIWKRDPDGIWRIPDYLLPDWEWK